MPLDIGSQSPLVSVIIPTYNRPSYLKEAIKSAVQQHYQNIEIIVSDNCSPENPQAIVESFQDSRIRFYRNATNIGMSANITNAFLKARGKYVASLHDDDIWNEDFLAKLVPPLEANPELVLAFCDHYIIDADGMINYPATNKCTQDYKRDQLKKGAYQPFYQLGLVNNSVPSSTSSVIRKDVVDWDNIPSDVEGMWDFYLTYLCCRSGRGAFYYPERLIRYRVHGQNDSIVSYRKQNPQDRLGKAKAAIFCYERFMEDKQLQELKPYFRQKWLYANASLGIGLLRTEQVAQARSYLWQALREQKFNLRTTIALILGFTPKQFTARMLEIL